MKAAALAASAALLFAGCAAMPVYEGGRAWDQGWREGSVEKVAAGSDLGYQHTYDCRYREGRAGRHAVGLFSVVAVHGMGRHRHHVVPVEPGKEMEVGDKVLTNVRGCEQPVVRAAR